MSDEPLIIDFRIQAENEIIVTFHRDGTIEVGERWKDQPEEAARLFLSAIERQSANILPDGYICKPVGFPGGTIVTDAFERIGWENIGYSCRGFRYIEPEKGGKETDTPE